MSKSKDQSPRGHEDIKLLGNLLSEQIHITSLIVAILAKVDFAKSMSSKKKNIEDDVRSTLLALYHSLGISGSSLLTLVNPTNFSVRDCYTISRSILELSVNICYIISEGKSAAQKAIDHAQQKSFRDLNRESLIGKSVIKVSFTGKPHDIKQLKRLAANFTSRTGREKGWIDLNIDKRIEFCEKLGHQIMAKLHSARFILYRHSSEIIHGTLFGSLYMLGLTQPNKEPTRDLELFEKNIANQLITLLFALNFCLSATIQAFDNVYGFEEGEQRSKTCIAQMEKIEWLSKKS